MCSACPYSNDDNFVPDLHNIPTTYVVKKDCSRHKKRLKIIIDFPIIDAASTLVLQQRQYDIFEEYMVLIKAFHIHSERTAVRMGKLYLSCLSLLSEEQGWRNT